MKTFVMSLLVLVCLAGCTRTVVNQPFSEKVSKEREVESRVQIALIYLEQNDPEQAIFELRKAMDVMPRSARVHEVLALSLERIQDYERADRHFGLMLRYDPGYTRGRANYASYLIRRDNCPEAYSQFQRVVDDIYYPNRAIAYQQLGFCAGKLGRQQEMLTAYQRAIALDNKFAPPLLELAVVQFDTKNYPESQRYFDLYRSRVEQSSASALLLGVKLSRVFRDRDAEASYALALRNLYPRSQEYLEYLKIIDNNGQ